MPENLATTRQRQQLVPLQVELHEGTTPDIDAIPEQRIERVALHIDGGQVLIGTPSNMRSGVWYVAANHADRLSLRREGDGMKMKSRLRCHDFESRRAGRLGLDEVDIRCREGGSRLRCEPAEVGAAINDHTRSVASAGNLPKECFNPVETVRSTS